MTAFRKAFLSFSLRTRGQSSSSFRHSNFRVKMTHARNAENDLRYAFKYVRPLLSILGVWPISIGSPLPVKILQRSVAFFCLFLQLFVLGPGILYVIMKETNSRRQLKLFAPLINGLGQLIKYTILLCRINELGRLLSSVKRDWLNAVEEDRMILRKKSKIGHRVIIIVAITMYGGGLSYRTLLPLSKGKIVLPNNATIRLLPCPSYFIFFSEQSSPCYEIIFAMQVLAGFVNYTVLCGSIGICACLCLHMCSLLRILTGKMMGFTDINENSHAGETIVQQKIVNIVEFQTKIKRFLNDVELVTRYLCFSEIIGDTCITCIIGYCIIMEWENNNVAALGVYFLLLVTYILTNFTVCYVGQLLINESNNLGKVSNTLNWYRFPTKKARCLIPIIMMSNYSMKLTAGKMVDISLATFTDLMKASVGYLNMLRELV